MGGGGRGRGVEGEGCCCGGRKRRKDGGGGDYFFCRVFFSVQEVKLADARAGRRWAEEREKDEEVEEEEGSLFTQGSSRSTGQLHISSFSCPDSSHRSRRDE